MLLESLILASKLVAWCQKRTICVLQSASQGTVDPLGISSPVPQSPSDVRVSRLSVDIPPPAVGEKRRSSQDAGAVASPTKKAPQLPNFT